MKRLLTAALWTALTVAGAHAQNAAPAADATAPLGTLTLANGDRLQVRIEGYDAAGGYLVARHPFAKAPLEIATAALSRFAAPAAPAAAATAPAAEDEWALQMSNGDQIRGVLVRIDGERARVKNGIMSELSVPRAGLVSLTRSTSARTLYEGPTADEEWERQRASFKVAGKVLEVPQGQVVGRKLPAMPRRARIDFTIRSGFPMFVVGFYQTSTSGLNDGNSPGYQLHYQMGNQLMLFRNIPNMGGQQVGMMNLGRAGVSSRGAVVMTVFTDLDTRRILVYLNNRPVADWTDSTPFENPGDALSFLTHNTPLEVSKIRVTDWDGRVPEGEKPRATGDADLLQLKNGDSLSGTVLAITPPQASVRTPFGELAIPFANLNRIDFKTGEAPANPGLPRFQLRDGTTLAVKPIKIEKGMFHCESASAGAVRIPVAQLQQISWPAAAAGDEDEDAPEEAPSGPRARTSVFQQGGANVMIQVIDE